jgi:hypothetical protein
MHSGIRPDRAPPSAFAEAAAGKPGAPDLNVRLSFPSPKSLALRFRLFFPAS